MRDWILKKHGPALMSFLFSSLLFSAAMGQTSVVEQAPAGEQTPGMALTPGLEPVESGVEVAPFDSGGSVESYGNGDYPIESSCEACESQLVVTLKTCGRIEPVVICPHDDVWLVSARCSHFAPADLSLLKCSRLQNGNWQDAPLDELTRLHSADKSKVTLMYVHGNRTALRWAKSRGLQFYKNAFQKIPRPPIRFVIFAWRSDVESLKVCEDYKIKSRRSVEVGETLGRLLCQFGDRELVLGGFSLGAQVVLTALADPGLQQAGGCPGKYRVAIFAPALNWRYVKSRLPYFPQNPVVHQTDVFLNRRDYPVRVAQTIARRRNQTEFTMEDLKQFGLSSGNQISICDITKEVSCRHSIVSYSRSQCLNVKLAEMVSATYADGSKLPIDCLGSQHGSLEAFPPKGQKFRTAMIKPVAANPAR